MYVNVCVNERKAVCASIREREEKWKILYEVIGKRKEKVISHIAHLPVCLKGLSARMMNKFDKCTHTTVFSSFSGTQKHIACALLSIMEYLRQGWFAAALLWP